MKITKRQLRRVIKEALEIHFAPDGLSRMSPEEAYGLGYYAGKDYVGEEAEKSVPFGSGLEPVK